MEPKPKERIVFDEDPYYGAEGEKMEFSVSLPGDEKDEDGYSLTGEAKDATASRDGLNGNQTRTLEETVTECKEAATALANGDAL